MGEIKCSKENKEEGKGWARGRGIECLLGLPTSLATQELCSLSCGDFVHFVLCATQDLRGGYAPPQDGYANPAVANFVGRDFVPDGYANPAAGGYADEVPTGWLRQPYGP